MDENGISSIPEVVKIVSNNAIGQGNESLVPERQNILEPGPTIAASVEIDDEVDRQDE